MVCLLELELICWPLTRREGHTATTKETERPPPPGGPAGAMRRNARGRRRDRSRRAGMIDAARRWKARATAGCAQAPALKPQAGPRASKRAVWIRWKTGGEKVLFRETAATKLIGQGRRESTSRLRDVPELDAVVGQQATTHLSRWSLNAVEHRTACEAEGNCHGIGDAKSLRCATGSTA